MMKYHFSIVNEISADIIDLFYILKRKHKEKSSRIYAITKR